MKLIDLTGQKFGRLTVIQRVAKPKERKSKEAFWLCKCDCGNERIVSGYEIRSGNTKSCGCYHKDLASQVHKKHGYCGTRLYRIYYKMKERCYKPSNDNYKYYGGLGITICDEWLNDFSTFAMWSIENGYGENLTIDRKDNTKGYSPDNCRWITIQEQQRNRRKRGTVYGSK